MPCYRRESRHYENSRSQNQVRLFAAVAAPADAGAFHAVMCQCSLSRQYHIDYLNYFPHHRIPTARHGTDRIWM